jgi:hypothetical protein
MLLNPKVLDYAHRIPPPFGNETRKGCKLNQSARTAVELLHFARTLTCAMPGFTRRAGAALDGRLALFRAGLAVRDLRKGESHVSKDGLSHDPG